MRFRPRDVALVLTVSLACTGGPVVLPQGGDPPRCAFDGIRTAHPTRPGAPLDAVLGQFWVRSIDRDRLAWVDPVTLRRVSARSSPFPQAELSSVTPDGQLVAVPAHGIAILDTRTMAFVATIPAARGQVPNVFSWLSDHVLAGIGEESAVLWNAQGDELRRSGFRQEFHLTGWVTAPDRLVALVYSSPDTRAARLLSISRTGLETIALDRVQAGYDPGIGDHGTFITPGLAYDPIDERAFVLQSDGPIAEVSLRSGTVVYHALSSSWIETVSSALVPSASAKLSDWSERQAIWLGSGIVAVSGSDGDVMGGTSTAVGVHLVDTKDWTVCTLDDRATRIGLAHGVLVASGGAGLGEFGGVGLLGWSLHDGRRWHLFGQQSLDVQMSGRYVYAINSWNGWHVSTVDAASAHVIARLGHRPPTVLPEGSSLQSQ